MATATGHAKGSAEFSRGQIIFFFSSSLLSFACRYACLGKMDEVRHVSCDDGE